MLWAPTLLYVVIAADRPHFAVKAGGSALQLIRCEKKEEGRREEEGKTEVGGGERERRATLLVL